MKVQRNTLQKCYCDILGDFRYARFHCWDPIKVGCIAPEGQNLHVALLMNNL